MTVELASPPMDGCEDEAGEGGAGAAGAAARGIPARSRTSSPPALMAAARSRLTPDDAVLTLGARERRSMLFPA